VGGGVVVKHLDASTCSQAGSGGDE
jgi:hypothetical protein